MYVFHDLFDVGEDFFMLFLWLWILFEDFTELGLLLENELNLIDTEVIFKVLDKLRFYQICKFLLHFLLGYPQIPNTY